MELLTELRKRVEQGLITEKFHPEFPLSIFNYTPQCQYGKLWDEYTLMARGLILNNETGEIVARPFPKFFNLSEHETNPGKGDPVVYEKMDGSLGIVFVFGNQVHLATRGSFNSEQALTMGPYLDRLETVYEGKTYLFELIYPKNRIVVDYGNRQEVVYLGTIDNTTGEFEFDCPGWYKTANVYDFKSVEELPTHMDNAEGFVLYYPENNTRVKIKFDEYVRLHKIMTDYSIKRLWESLSKGEPLDAFLKNVPDEFYQQVQEDKKKLEGYYNFHQEMALTYHMSTILRETRKDQALYLKKEHPEYMPIVFKMLDGKDPSDLIWKKVKEECVDG